jgi:hypothetical protein
MIFTNSVSPTSSVQIPYFRHSLQATIALKSVFSIGIRPGPPARCSRYLHMQISPAIVSTSGALFAQHSLLGLLFNAPKPLVSAIS